MKNVCNTLWLHKSRCLSPPPGEGGGKADILSERPVGGANRRRLERKSNKGNKFGPIFDTWRSAACARRLQYIVDTSCALAPRLSPYRSPQKTPPLCFPVRLHSPSPNEPASVRACDDRIGCPVYSVVTVVICLTLCSGL